MGPITFFTNQFRQFINRVEVYKSNTLFETFPRIRGRIFIKNNNGLIILGKQVIFNSTVTSNFAGLYKTSTIYMEPDACLQIGDHSGFSGVSIYCSRSITIGKHVNCGSNVCIWDTDFHPLHYMERRTHKKESIHKKPIVIEDDVFIGGNSIILKGVSIGARSVIGAGSIVTRCVPADEVWAGNPAKFIKRINW